MRIDNVLHNRNQAELPANYDRRTKHGITREYSLKTALLGFRVYALVIFFIYYIFGGHSIMESHCFKAVIGENTEAKVKFCYYFGRPARIYGDDPHPEDPPECDITSVFANGGEFMDDLSEECLDRIEAEAFEYLNSLGVR